MSVVKLPLAYRNVSSNIRPEGITAHYGGPSNWTGANRTSGAAFARSTDHARCATVVASWHAYHISKGWSGLAYTSVVCPHGTVFDGRGKGKRTAANGTNTGNDRSYAVCYLAGDNDPLTDEAKRAYHSEASRLGVPLRWIHREWKSTSCPGAAVEAWAKQGWPMPGGTTRPTPIQPGHPAQITSEELDMTEAQLRKIVAEELGKSRSLGLVAEYGTLEKGADGYGEQATAKREEQIKNATLEYVVAALGPRLTAIEASLEKLVK